MFILKFFSYELSQDLLEKQIELLERKYGGIRARNAAIIIQRAFRHYMMVKKFASITAMAKTDKRISRQALVLDTSCEPPSVSTVTTSVSLSYLNSVDVQQSQLQQPLQHQQSTITHVVSATQSSPRSQNLQTYQHIPLQHQNQQQQPQHHHQQQQQPHQHPRVMILPGPPVGNIGNISNQSVTTNLRMPPTRSVSMRERRHVDGGAIPRG